MKHRPKKSNNNTKNILGHKFFGLNQDNALSNCPIIGVVTEIIYIIEYNDGHKENLLYQEVPGFPYFAKVLP
jgi:hypothetical protein